MAIGTNAAAAFGEDAKRGDPMTLSPLFKRGLILLIVQLVLVGSLAAKYFNDRARYPRAWVKTLPYDPNLPIRGRYVTMTAVIETDAFPAGKKVPESERFEYFCAALSVRDGKLFGRKAEDGSSCEMAGFFGRTEATLQSPLAYFIPDTAKDPARESAENKEELWVEVTVPPKGPPRPLRLGVKKPDGEIRPLDIN
jgi:hypothetical protein